MTDTQSSTTLAEERAVRNADHGVWKRLYHGETQADIVGRWKTWFALSGALLLIGVLALATRGLNLGIDFTGGTVWELEAGDATVAEVTEAMTALGYQDPQVQEVTQTRDGSDVRLLRVEAEAAAGPSAATTAALDDLRADLGALRADVPGDAQAAVDVVINTLSGVEGPFRTDVPEPLAALSSEVDGLTAALADAADDDARLLAVESASDRLRDQAEQLVALEATERARLNQDVTAELSRLTGTPEEEISIDRVGPSWGQQISEKARNALVVFLIAIAIFITIRFELKMAVATLVALFHDLLLVVGLYALFGFAVTPATVIALLTMLGFSIYDGIVVFDRIDENTKLLSGSRARMTYTEMANLSLNQVLMRSLNTSITTLLPIGSVLVIGAVILGATTLQEYGIALFLGLLVGAYSSLFIATPLLALLKEREPTYREIRERLSRSGRTAPATAGSDDDAAQAPVAGAIDNPLAPGSLPRPRRTRKR